jgi:DNA mismatch endonuclease (patch repair protein)
MHTIPCSEQTADNEASKIQQALIRHNAEYGATMDRLTPDRRSWNMSRIRNKDTSPERKVRSLLHRAGLRFSLRRTDLPGKPDIVLPRFHTVIFVHGCFWHRHKNCPYAVLPKTRPDFWLQKLTGNADRDSLIERTLKNNGWKVIIVWACELKSETTLAERLIEAIESDNRHE